MKHSNLFIALLFVFFHFSASLHAQIDPTFVTGGGTNGAVNAIAIQEDGRILIGGLFTYYKGVASNGIVRLNADGSVDNTFKSGAASNSNVLSISIQLDGKIVIGGVFSSYNGTTINNIARLNADGSLDPNFKPGSGPNNTVSNTTILSNGKILIGGSFYSYNGTTRYFIARLYPDGSLDASFNSGSGPSGSIYTHLVQSDGKIIVGGTFYSYNGSTLYCITRLNADGTLDNTFSSGTGTGMSGNPVYSLALQEDGKIIVGGYFSKYNGTSRNGVVRLLPNGTLDASFQYGEGTSSSNTVYKSLILPDKKILLGGSISTYDGTTVKNILRLKADGSFDTDFAANTPSSTVSAMALQKDGKIVLGGNFTSYNGTVKNYLVRIVGDAVPLSVEEEVLNGKQGANLIYQVYPNPTKDQVRIVLDKSYEEALVSVRNSLNQEVSRNSFSGQKELILSLVGDKGLYFLEITTSDGQKTLKVMKE